MKSILYSLYSLTYLSLNGENLHPILYMTLYNFENIYKAKQLKIC